MTDISQTLYAVLWHIAVPIGILGALGFLLVAFLMRRIPVRWGGWRG